MSFSGCVATNQYSYAAILEFSSELQTLTVKGENCVFYGVFWDYSAYLNGTHHMVHNGAQKYSWDIDLVGLGRSEPWFSRLEEKDGMLRPPCWGFFLHKNAA